jgi:hypothetical protein
MRYLAFSTNSRIIMKHIILTLTMALLIGMPYLSINAGTLAVSGTLSKEVTSTANTDAIIVRDCNGLPLDTIPSEAVTTTKYEPYAKNSQTVRFEVTRLENPEVAIVTIDTNINNFSYNAADGKFSINLTRLAIIESRYNYKVKARISENSYATVIFEREYALAPAGSGSAFPIGSVIAYLGNNNNIAGMAANGWFKCNGATIDTISALSVDERTALKNILGGNSNLPDLRGNFLRGLDEGRGFDDDAGTRTGGESTTGVRSQQGEAARSHRHSGATDAGGNHDHGGFTGNAVDADNNTITFVNARRTNLTTGGGGDAASDDNQKQHRHTIPASGNHTHGFTTGDPTSSSTGVVPVNGNENRPDNMAVYWLIRGR